MAGILHAAVKVTHCSSAIIPKIRNCDGHAIEANEAHNQLHNQPSLWDKGTCEIAEA
jgi:hypothetical protein